ncbi:hypothetical protein V7152_29450 [Neobacillus drentensis]|uniref:hypothetical protein n=1 Tax=Neobacillus drentensis TaxID=220684 RepID=UPI002FFD787D
MEEQKQYHDDLLEWCNNIYSNWESMKPRFSQIFDMESLEEWEGSFRHLKEKLQADLKADFDDYQTAKSLYEQWEQLFKESDAYQEEIEVDSDKRLELEEQLQFDEELLETNVYQEEIEVDSDKRLELEEQQQFHEEYLETDAYQEEIEVETDKCMDLEEQPQYREDLLEWCNNIYSNWESMKPRFSQLFNMKSLEEWEGSCRQLKEKLQTDLKADFDDYQTAKSLYEQWEQLFKESYAYKEVVSV